MSEPSELSSVNLNLVELFERLQEDFGVYESIKKVEQETGKRPKFMTMHPFTFHKYFGLYNPLILMGLRIVKEELCPKDMVYVSVEPFTPDDLDQVAVPA